MSKVKADGFKNSKPVRMLSAEEFQWGWPARLYKSLDLTDREIYKALITDSSRGPWMVSNQILPAASSGKASISLTLLRDIHLFVIRAAKARTLAYVREKDEFRPTALGIELSRIESALKSGIPSKYSQYSEHVQLFLDAYTELGMDGGRGNADVILGLTDATGLRNEFPDALVTLIRARYAAKPTKASDEGQFSPMLGQTVYIDKAPLLYTDNLKRSLRVRRDKSVKNNRKATKFIFRAFQQNDSLRVVRLDFGLKPEYVKDHGVEFVKVLKGYLDTLFNNGAKKTGPFRGLVGRFGKLEYTKERGFYCHVMFMFSCAPNMKFLGLEERIGALWTDKITEGRGVYAVVGRGASEFKLKPTGKIRRMDKIRRVQLLRAVRYLTITDEYLKLDVPAREVTFFASDMLLESRDAVSIRKRRNILNGIEEPAEDFEAAPSWSKTTIKDKLDRFSRRIAGPDEELSDEKTAEDAGGNDVESANLNDAAQDRSDDTTENVGGTVTDDQKPDADVDDENSAGKAPRKFKPSPLGLGLDYGAEDGGDDSLGHGDHSDTDDKK